MDMYLCAGSACVQVCTWTVVGGAFGRLSVAMCVWVCVRTFVDAGVPAWMCECLHVCVIGGVCAVVWACVYRAYVCSCMPFADHTLSWPCAVSRTGTALRLTSAGVARAGWIPCLSKEGVMQLRDHALVLNVRCAVLCFAVLCSGAAGGLHSSCAQAHDVRRAIWCAAVWWAGLQLGGLYRVTHHEGGEVDG